MYNEIDYLYTI